VVPHACIVASFHRLVVAVVVAMEDDATRVVVVVAMADERH
jgi:hypothetical protein